MCILRADTSVTLLVFNMLIYSGDTSEMHFGVKALDSIGSDYDVLQYGDAYDHGWSVDHCPKHAAENDEYPEYEVVCCMCQESAVSPTGCIRPRIVRTRLLFVQIMH